jgi:transposase
LIALWVTDLLSADSVSRWNILQPPGAGLDRKSGRLIMSFCGKDKVVCVPARKAYMGVDVWLHKFLTLALGEWSTSRGGRFMPKKKTRNIN